MFLPKEKKPNKMKVIIISRNKVLPFGTTQLRCIQPFEYLKKLGFSVSITELTKYTPAKEDILILHRITGNLYNRSLIEYAQANKTKVIYDTDDLIFNSKGVNYLSKLGLKKHAKEKEKIVKLIANCDAISVSTSPLQYYAKKLHPHSFIIKNALSYLFFEKSQNRPAIRKSDGRITIAYLSGSGTHDNDFKVVADGLFNILTDFPETQLLIVGPLTLDDKFHSFGKRLILKRFMPYHKFQNVFIDIDINLIPLEINEAFCQSKSELKFIEAAAFSVPSIATPTAPHCEAIIHNSNGLLSKEDQWYDNIKKLLDEQTRKKIGKEAFKTVLAQYSPTTREKDWKELLIKINNLKTKNHTNPIIIPLIKLKFNIYKFFVILYEKQKGWEYHLRTVFFKKSKK